jgi:hypothetical protein
MKMKKLGAFLLVIALAGPWIALACDCCPAKATPSSGTVLTSEHCGCCPEALQIDQKDLGITGSQKSLEPTLLRLALHLTAVAAIIRFNPFEASTPARPSLDLGPPGLFSETPLYLSLSVLRL